MRCATNGRFPQIVIWENVPGAFSSTQGEDFRTVIETLWKICEGNGMAFPCMLYIMEGVQEVLAERYLDNLFGGDTAEP